MQTTPTHIQEALNLSVRREEIQRAADGMKEAIERLRIARENLTHYREQVIAARATATTEALNALDDLDLELREVKRDLLGQMLPEPAPTIGLSAPPSPPSARSASGSTNSPQEPKDAPLWGCAPAGRRP